MLKALGIQGEAVKITMLVYGPVFIPMAYLFAITLALGYKGLWLALMITMTLLSIGFDNIIGKTDWNKAMEDSTNRRSNDEKDKEN